MAGIHLSLLLDRAKWIAKVSVPITKNRALILAGVVCEVSSQGGYLEMERILGPETILKQYGQAKPRLQ